MPGGLFNFRISFQLGGPDRRAGNDGGRFDLSRNQVDVLSDRLARSLRARRPRRRRRRTDAAATNCDMHARDPATGSKTRKRSRWTATPSSPARSASPRHEHGLGRSVKREVQADAATRRAAALAALAAQRPASEVLRALVKGMGCCLIGASTPTAARTTEAAPSRSLSCPPTITMLPRRCQAHQKL